MRSGRREDALRARWDRRRRALGGTGERRIALEHRHHALGEEPHVQLRLLVRHAAEREFGHQVVEAGEPAQFGDLLQTVVGRADDLDLDVELGGFLPELSSFILE